MDTLSTITFFLDPNFIEVEITNDASAETNLKSFLIHRIFRKASAVTAEEVIFV